MARIEREGTAAEEPEGPAPKASFLQILRDPNVLVAMLLVFVVMLGFGIIVPILPLYARSFGVGHDATGLLISGFAMTRLVFDLVAGPIIDRYGERVTAAAGAAVVGASVLLMAMAPSFVLAVLFRSAGGAGSSVFFAAVFSYLLRVVPKDRMGRSLSVFFGSFNVGIIAGAPVGGVLAGAFGLRAPLFVYSGMLFAAGLLYFRFLREGPPASSRGPGRDPQPARGVARETTSHVRELLGNRAFRAVILLNFATMWIVAGVFDTLVPLFADEGLGMSPGAIGAAFALLIAVDLAVLYPAGSLADRIGRRPVVIPALVGLAVTIPMIGFAADPLTFGILMALLGLASGTVGVLPAAMLSDVVPDERRGTPVGVYRFFGDIGFVFGPLVAGVATDLFGFATAFAVSIAPIVLALVVVIRTPETMPQMIGPR
jgi:DHA1 family multidrug resistance protein-like MFS transporter